MSNTNLTASVNLKVKGLARVQRMVKNIEQVQKQVREAGNQANYFSRKIVQATDKVNGLASANKQVASTAKKATKEYSAMGKVISAIGSKLKWLASVYLGVMGMGAAVRTSDTITSAQNKFNALNGNNTQLTKDTMDKIFGAAQRSRTGYTDMLNNVSKSMTLAGDAFKGNIDNAIKFQEIMGKTYALGGASAAEQASSMYQLVQALGSGKLQGDELRSVTEGAPLAAKNIEKFAQEIYKSEESLKDLASQGKITSDIVVAAMLSMEGEVNEQFAKTKVLFSQAWTMIKNTAIKSFEPVLEMMNDALNSDFGRAVVDGIGKAIQVVANALLIVFNLVKKVYEFVVAHWSVIKPILVAIGTALTIYVVYKLALIAQQISTLIFGLLVALGSKIAFITSLFIEFGIKGALSLLFVNWHLLAVIAVLAIVIAAVWWVSDSFRDACGNIVGAVFWVLGVIHNAIALIINFALGLLNVMNAVCTNIGIAFQNAWHAASASFWEWVQECLNGTGLIAKAVSKIAEVFGLDAVSIDTKINTARGKMKDYVSIGDAWKTGSSVAGYADVNAMFNKGYGYGTSAYDWVSNKLTGGLASVLPGLDSTLNTNAYDPAEMAKNIGDTAGNTGKMADAMELAEEDLEYLRKIADMEWRKEFTTAEIKVDMSNYNTVNGDSDLDGIVTRLADKLYEELDMVANGVYA